jgi:uncharacterized membrane protein YkvA (DUF1232 family)
MNEKDIRKYQDHYSESGLLGKLSKVAKKAGQKIVYAVMLLYYVIQSPEISKGDKATIIGALGYFILPLDLLPDFIPVLGFTDDLSAILLALHAVWKNITPDVKAKASAKVSGIFSDFDQEKIDKELVDEQ